MFMGRIKLFGKKIKKELVTLIIRIHCQDIRMEFGIEKYTI